MQALLGIKQSQGSHGSPVCPGICPGDLGDHFLSQDNLFFKGKDAFGNDLSLDVDSKGMNKQETLQKISPPL
jgi:hypothetical protein